MVLASGSLVHCRVELVDSMEHHLHTRVSCCSMGLGMVECLDMVPIVDLRVDTMDAVDSLFHSTMDWVDN